MYFALRDNLAFLGQKGGQDKQANKTHFSFMDLVYPLDVFEVILVTSLRWQRRSSSKIVSPFLRTPEFSVVHLMSRFLFRVHS